MEGENGIPVDRAAMRARKEGDTIENEKQRKADTDHDTMALEGLSP